MQDDTLQLLVDESQIRRLLALYPRALDRQDGALLASLFHDGAVDLHGIYNGSATGFVEFMQGRARPGHHWMHHNGTQIIDIEADKAHAETYALAFYRRPAADADGKLEEIFMRVRYLDHLEKRGGRWGITNRRVVFGPCQILTVTEEYPVPLWPDALVDGPAGIDPAYQW
jgi:hypothetical protein